MNGLTDPRLVVAAAVRRGNAVLIAARSHPPELAGQWEFPGGTVEPGETPERALVRECHEELGLAVVPLARLQPQVPLPAGRALRLYACAAVGPAPVAHEHQALRWVLARQLDDVEWVGADVVLVAGVRRWLTSLSG
jgi:8-oxo-dGTP diphosphatase